MRAVIVVAFLAATRGGSVPSCTVDEELQAVNLELSCVQVDCRSKYGEAKPLFNSQVSRNVES
jgi:hypothetical protein